MSLCTVGYVFGTFCVNLIYFVISLPYPYDLNRPGHPGTKDKSGKPKPSLLLFEDPKGDDDM